MEFVNGKDDIPYIMENKKCVKQPTSIYWWFGIPSMISYLLLKG